MYEFDGYRLDPLRRVLSRADGTPVALKSKVFDTLLYLVEHPGELLDKNELLSAVWPNVVVEESNLNKNVSLLRQALGETRDDHRFIVTEAGRGYRFVAPVVRLQPDRSGAPAPAGAASGELAAAGAAPLNEVETGAAREPGAALTVPSPGEAGALPRRPRLPRAVAIAAGLALLIAAAASAVLRRPAAPPETRLEIATPPTVDPWSIAISPDGRSVVYATAAEGGQRLSIRTLEADRAAPLAGTDGASFPFWSPDGRSIGFFADGELRTLEVQGGERRRLAAATAGHGGSWGRDGTVLFVPDRSSPVMSVPSGGGPVTAVTRLDEGRQVSHNFPVFLPDGRHFLYFAQGGPDHRGVFLGRLDGADVRRLVDADGPAVYAAAGYLLFIRGEALLARRFDAQRLALVDTAFTVAEPVMVDGGTNYGALSAAAAGPFVYRLGAARRSELVWFDRSDRRLGTVGESRGAAVWSPSLSPDGRLIAFYGVNDRNTDVWTVDAERNVTSRVTFDPAFDNSPVWSPDSEHLVLASNRNGSLDLYRKPVATAGAEQLLLSSSQNKVPTDWSRDGRYLLYRVTDATTKYDVFALLLDAAQDSVTIAATEYDERDAQLSPDGNWVAYQSNETGRFEIYVQSFPEAGVKHLVSAGGGAQARWRADGEELFYVSLTNRLMTTPVAFDADGRIEIGAPAPLFAVRTRGGAVPFVETAQYAVSPDGQQFLINSEIDSENTAITIVLDWAPRAP